MSVRHCTWIIRQGLDVSTAYHRLTRIRVHVREAVSLGVLGVALATPALAQSRMVYLNGNELYEMCQVDQATCAGYIMGVADALEATAWPAKRSCRPKVVESLQVIDLAIKTLEERPAERHRPAFDLIADEVVRLWPC